MTKADSFIRLATAGVQQLSPYLPGKPPEQLEREYGVSNAIKLASNENPYEVPAGVREALRRCCDDISRYPDGAGFALRAALSAHLDVPADCITLGNGSNEVLVLLAETFLSPAVAAIYDQYSFVVYRLAVQATGAEARIAPSNPRDHAQPLGHDPAAMLALVDDKTRLIYIANPNNPTGTWLTTDELRDFLAALPASVIVVVDEAYFEYAQAGDMPDASLWLQDFPNLVVTRTFSKAYGLAGVRVGYALSSPEIADLLNRVRQPFNVNSVAQATAMAALGEYAWVQHCVAENNFELEHLRHGLTGIGLEYLPTRGNFLLVQIPNAAACNEFLLRDGVIVRPVANYGLPDYLRISVGTRAENHRLLAALTAYMDTYSG